MAPFIDKTGIFKDILKNTQSREDLDIPKPDKNRILQRKDRDPLEVKAHLIIEHTTQLRDFLAENREPYIDVLNKTYSSTAMSDLERDKIDAGANALIRTINGLVYDFKKDLRSKMSKLSGQHNLHLEAVSDILESDLKLACQNFSEQRAIRVQKELEVQKMSRLEIKARKGSLSDELIPGVYHVNLHIFPFFCLNFFLFFILYILKGEACNFFNDFVSLYLFLNNHKK